MMRWWEDDSAGAGAEIDANPSPGNKAGGLTAILETSLDAMRKAGGTNVVEVVRYAEAETRKGFAFTDAPGCDPVSATGQMAGSERIKTEQAGFGASESAP